MDGWIDGWMDRWMIGWMDGWNIWTGGMDVSKWNVTVHTKH